MLRLDKRFLATVHHTADELSSASAAEQFIHAHPQRLRQLRQLADIRHGSAALPIADRLKAHAHAIRQRGLRHILFFPQARNPPPDLHRVKHIRSPSLPLVCKTRKLAFVLSFHYILGDCVAMLCHFSSRFFVSRLRIICR
ncbi:hypothetical protein SDC9_143296 [bioreactor metagenome]|uniref:Uncharacterized protein n=1 Tax=bioreactor metagenome TaxID=1076179 RepID=A0A645E3L9_9ZZZZ